MLENPEPTSKKWNLNSKDDEKYISKGGPSSILSNIK